MCFKMLKFSLCCYSNYESPNLKDCSEVRSADPTISFYC